MSEKFPGFKQREDMIQFAADIRAETMKILHEERDKDRALLERMVNHLTVPPRSTWRVVQLAGDDTPHDVGIEFPAQVVYVDNGSTANVQVRAPGDIAQSPPIAASGQGAWLIPGATQLTVTGTGTGQVRLRFLNEAAARLLYTGGPGGSTASPLYAELTGSLALLPSYAGGEVSVATSITIAASSSYISAGYDLLGYRQANAQANGVSGTSPSWDITIQARSPSSNYAIKAVSSGALATVGSGFNTGILTFFSEKTIVEVDNNSSTDSLTVASLLMEVI